MAQIYRVKNNRLIGVFFEVIAIILACMVFYPFVYMLFTSLKDPIELSRDPLGFPTAIFVDNYVKAWQNCNFGLALKNSILITGGSLFGIVFLSSLAAFPIARVTKKLSSIIYVYFSSGLMIPFQAGMVPLVLMVKRIGLMNNLIGIICVYIAMQLPLAVLLYTGFLKSVPVEIEESALIDGCSRVQMYIRIIFPLVKTTTATVLITTSLTIWNDFLIPLLLYSGANNRTIQTAIYIFFGRYNTNWGYAFAMLVLGIIPLLTVFFILQKNFVKGIAAGAVKG